MLRNKSLKNRYRDTIAGALEATGIDRETLLREARASDALMGADDSPERVTLRLWQVASALTGNTSIPMLCGSKVPFGAFEVIDFLAVSASTVGAGLSQLGRYFAIITPNVKWRFESNGESYQVALRHCDDGAVGQAFTQFTLGVTITRFKNSAAGKLAFTSAQFSFPTPSHIDDYRQLLGDCPLSFGHEETLLELPAKSWNLPMLRSEAALAGVLERHAQGLLADIDQHDALAKARIAVREALPQGPPRLVDVAQGLAMSERTLQRRLGERGFNFQKLVDEQRQQSALEHIRNPRLSVGDVAYLLGYSESSAFVRAFKRWTGATPNAYRRSA